MKVLIIEDSRLARLELKELLQAYPQLELVGEAADVPTALKLVAAKQPDLLLLDIDLGGATAFDLLAELVFVPKIIFTTAFAEHALQAFNYPTVDYLLKPVTAERLAQALAKLPLPSLANAAQATTTQTSTDQGPADQNPGDQNPGDQNPADQNPGEESSASNPPERLLQADSNFFVKDGEDCYFLKINDVRWFEAVGNYSKVHLKSAAPMVYRTLASIEQRLAPGLFFRANRQQLVNLTAVVSIEPSVSGGLTLRLQCGTEVEVSRRQSAELRQQLSL
ncbi:MAG: response regulator transcription factor [Gammaproteobacteria bacterium]|nr:response regulator transcription factor [Gammaproteobacteria bacterium]